MDVQKYKWALWGFLIGMLVANAINAFA